jgi:acyl carrier protein
LTGDCLSEALGYSFLRRNLMTKEEIRSKVVEIAKEKLGVEESRVTDEAQYVKDLGADSLALVDITMALEDAFGTSIPDEDIEKIASVGQTVDYVMSHLA